MKKLLIAVCVMFAMPLGACGDREGLNSIPSSPASVADTTTMDETAAIKFELSVTAVADLATLAIKTGIVKDPATIARIHALVPKARAAVDAVRSAYNAANAAAWKTAFTEASKILADIQTLAAGDTP